MVTAKAVTINGKGGVEVLAMGTLEVREPGPGEVLVEVAAAGLNRADLLQRMGYYPAPPGAPPNVPGLEYAGRVAELGAGVSGLSVGDAVMGIAAGGGMASHITVHGREVIPVPEGMSLTDAAAIPEVFLTAYDALQLQGGLRTGQVVLLHAVGSGIGTAALQLVARAGARAFGTARTADKLDKCLGLGLAGGIHVQDGAFAEQLKALSGGRMADLILDTVGGAYLGENIRALALGGRLVVIGLLGGAKAELPLGLLLAKRASVHGSVLRSRPLEEKAALAQDFIVHVLPGFEDGSLRPVIDRVMPMADVAAAHTYLATDETLGKVILAW